MVLSVNRKLKGWDYSEEYKNKLKISKTTKIEWEYEDQIEIDITEDMFLMSEVFEGVRMYPYVVLDTRRYYLELKGEFKK